MLGSSRKKTARRGRKNKASRNNDQGCEALFADGYSAVSEFIRNAPLAIEYIVSKSSYYKEVEELLQLKKIVIPHHLRDEWNEPDLHEKYPRGPCFARVHLSSSTESEFFGNEKYFEKERDLIVMLDHVQDPHNFGAIARSAAFFGVNTIIIPNARQVSITRVTVAISQGAFAYLNVVKVPNLKRVIMKLKKLNYWALAADMEGESVETLVGFYDKVLLILGNEGSGLSDLVARQSDKIISIPRMGGLDSLNVSVAAGVFLHRLTQ